MHKISFCSARARGCLLVATLGCCGSASALDQDALNVSIFGSLRYDSNLFRLPDGVQPFGTGRRSATTDTVGLATRLEKSYGLQRFDLGASVTHDRYQPYDYLDATGRTLDARWAWAITPSLTGNLSIDQVEAPNNFSDTGFLTQSNKRKTEERRFDVNWRAASAVHPRAAVLQTQDKSEQTTFERQNSKTTSVEAAIVYDFRSGNDNQLYFRRGRGNYIDLGANPLAQYDARFNERETGVSAHWGVTGISSLDGKVGYLQREHSTYVSRDFSGTVGNLAFTYNLTGKTQLQVSLNRSLSSIQSNVTSYSRDTSLSINPIWFATGKITVRPSYTLLRRSFGGAIVPVSGDLFMSMRDTALQVDWSVRRWLDLSVRAVRSNRESNDRTYQFSDRGASVTATLRF